MSNATEAGKAKHDLPGRGFISLVISNKLLGDDYDVLLAT